MIVNAISTIYGPVLLHPLRYWSTAIMHVCKYIANVHMAVCTSYSLARLSTHAALLICDQLCQNPSLPHSMIKNSFHRQWISPSID